MALFLYTFSYGKTITVCPTCEISSIKKALELADNGDTILIKKGIYKEGNILVKKSVKIIGEGYPIIDGQKKYEVITVKANNVLVKGLVIQNSGKSDIEDIAGIKFFRTKNCRIEDCILKNNFWGIYFAASKNGVIKNNKVYGPAKLKYLKSAFGTRIETNFGNAIHLWHCKNMLVEGNHVKNHRDGIYFEFVKNSTIVGNISEENLRYGLHFMFSNKDNYINNVFRKNGAGVAVMYTKYVYMANNRFEYNWGPVSYGILLKEFYDSYIYHNTFYKNTTGIFSDNSNRTIIEENDFIENGWALRIWANSQNNIFKHNNFISNTFNVATNSFQNPNTYTENYWSDYKGYDLNHDGIGDVPYRPVSLFGYLSENYSQSVILSRSFFVYLLDLTERMFPMLIPSKLVDNRPLMRRYEWSK
ncbi:nitrous oxide reductase family maturation protein NosD [Persephonella hydrogeniphila]|uniref:nitrous oxide reductase family maturation protein NosD n=1 Tax=Persephonella hydrogeniphila TaxID=198703 RepID=UPI001FE7D79A|nr:nitrous oxide reductase family maturation protein NosD [Persephonella hydrogeniphila]